MKKLIKLSDTHYIIVDDSKIKEGDIFIHPNKTIERASRDLDGRGLNKIIYSTQPLSKECKYCTGACEKCVDNIKPLSLSEVEEVINGYNLEEISNKSFENMGYHSTVTPHEENQFKLGYKLGFKAHQELVKDKLFTIEDIQLAFAKGVNYATKPYPQNVQFENEFKQSLLPKTEWDIEINEQNKITLL